MSINMIDDSESNIDIESEYDPIEESTFSCTTHTDTVASTTSVSSGSTTNTTINNNSFSRPYSPVCRKGIVHEHDKPYLEFGHLSAEFIANDQGFRLPVTYQPYVLRVKGSKIDKFNWKTTFALNLPGIANHYRGNWLRIRSNNKSTYIVIDDVPWDKFEDRVFLSHKDLLTGQQYVCAKEKGSKPKPIVTKMQAIVVLNPEDARSLLNPSTDKEKASLKYWQQRTYIRVMEADEYFYEPKYVDLSADDKIFTVDDVPIFQKQRRLWHENQEKKKINVTEEEQEPQQKQQHEEQIILAKLGTPEYTYDAWAFS
ncbi:unnamed protein product [Rotaria magnacalcarata]|uniref:Uncharacterized protein n=1 Tax=Rotaria magnacalcarata TaxID=392030 RepID=A0A816MX47_9BILA|nr:unnamed protein product [Rotaria magnacalcarata]